MLYLNNQDNGLKMKTFKFVISMSLLFAFVAWPSHAQNENGTTEAGGSPVTATAVEASGNLENNSTMSLPGNDFSPRAGKLDTTARFAPHFDKYYDPVFPLSNPYTTPMIRNVSNAGFLWSGKGIGVMAMGSYVEQPFFQTYRSAGLGLAGQYGNFSFLLDASMANYVGMPLGSVNQFGYGGIARYKVSDVISLTAFGHYYTNSTGFSQAAYPFVNATNFGGFVSFSGDRLGIDLGAERYYDPMRRSWETVPIVTPTIKFDNGVSIGVPVGGAIKSAVEARNMKNMPPPPPPQRR